MHIVRVNQVNPIKQVNHQENYKLGKRATLTTWTKLTTYIHIIQSVVNQVSRVNQVSLLVARAQPREAARGGFQGLRTIPNIWVMTVATISRGKN